MNVYIVTRTNIFIQPNRDPKNRNGKERKEKKRKEKKRKEGKENIIFNQNYMKEIIFNMFKKRKERNRISEMKRKEEK